MHIVRNMHMYLPCKREIYAKHFAPQIAPLDSKNFFSLARENPSRPQFMLYLISEHVASRTLPERNDNVFRNFIPSISNLHETEFSRVIWSQLIICICKKRAQSRKCPPSLNCIFVCAAIWWKNGARFWLNGFSEVKGTPVPCRLA